jgi:hypothetical protein
MLAVSKPAITDATTPEAKCKMLTVNGRSSGAANRFSIRNLIEDEQKHKKSRPQL